ncbi:MAG: ComEC/Rec2 family competence protein [Bacteroidales bacterium]|nr:ComEC/Rec2 family competence protein [Bacteroidales bacterium]
MNLHQAPFGWLSCALALGMLLPESWADPLQWAGVAALAGLWALSLAAAPGRLWRWRHGPSVCILVATLALGSWLMQGQLQESPVLTQPLPVSATVRLLAPPRTASRSVRCQVELLACDEPSWRGGKILLYLPLEPEAQELAVGQVLDIEGELGPIRAVSDEFDYAAYMRQRGFLGQVYAASGKWRRSAFQAGFSLRVACERSRQRLLRRYGRAGLEPEPLALVAALTLGEKSLIDSPLKQRFASAGVAHILAVSGMHVGIVCGLLGLLLRPLVRRRRLETLRQLLLTALLWGYACLTGLSASVVRAVLMFSVVALGRCLRRRTSSWNALGFAAFVMLAIRPFYLFDAGFQLSFAAVASILWLQPCFRQQLDGGADPNSQTVTSSPIDEAAAIWGLPGAARSLAGYFKDLLSVSLAAQIGTAPLSVWYFHQFPNYFWLGNLLMVPLALAVTCLAVATLTLGWLPHAGPALAWLLNQAAGLFCRLAAVIDSLPASLAAGLYPEAWEIVLIYILLALIVSISKNKCYIYSLNRGLRHLKNLRYDFKNYR